MSTTAAERAARERVAQGLPTRVEDTGALARVAAASREQRVVVESSAWTDEPPPQGHFQGVRG